MIDRAQIHLFKTGQISDLEPGDCCKKSSRFWVGFRFSASRPTEDRWHGHGGQGCQDCPAVGAVQRWFGPWFHGWRNHHPRWVLQQVHQPLGRSVKQTVIPHQPKAARLHMLVQQPAELPTRKVLDDILSLVDLDAKDDLAILGRQDILLWQKATLQFATKIEEGCFLLTKRLEIQRSFTGQGASFLQTDLLQVRKPSPQAEAPLARARNTLAIVFSGKRSFHPMLRHSS